MDECAPLPWMSGRLPPLGSKVSWPVGCHDDTLAAVRPAGVVGPSGCRSDA